MIDIDYMTADLERIAIDPGSSFLSGGPTSLFTGENVTVGRVANPFLPKTPMPNPKDLAADIASHIISDVTSFAASYVGEKVGNLLTPPTPAEIIELSQSYLNNYIKLPTEVLQELSVTAESTTDSAQQNIINDELTKLQNNIDSTVGKINDKVSYIVNKLCPEWTQSIPAYIAQGPKWVKSQADMIDRRCCTQIEKTVAEQADKLEKKKRDIINGIADGYAKQQAAKINEETYDKTYQKLKKVRQKQALAKNLAMSAAKQAILELKAALGQ